MLAFLATLGVEALLARLPRRPGALGLLALHATAACAWASWAASRDLLRPLPILLFWTGALLCWLGVRIHLERSILLRMAVLLRAAGTLSEAELQARCEAEHGIEARLRQLEAAGWLLRSRDRLEARGAGRRIRQLSLWLTPRWARPSRNGGAAWR